MILDITRTITPRTAVWPGDQPFAPVWSALIGEGSTVNVGSMTLSTHTGTHADAPLHFVSGGRPIDAIPLTHFVGEAWVVAVPEDDRIGWGHVQGVDLKRFKRILFRTRSSANPDDVWSTDFAAFEPALIDRLGDAGVVLIGTDAPSVDPADSEDLPAHHALARNGIVNIENLALHGVEPGPYRLVALPMKVAGLDAAPVRAILTPL